MKKRTSFISSMFEKQLYLEDIRSLEAAFVGNIDHQLQWSVSDPNYYVYEELMRKSCDELINTLSDMQNNKLDHKIKGYEDAYLLFKKLKSQSFDKNKIRADHNAVELSEADRAKFKDAILPNLISDVRPLDK